MILSCTTVWLCISSIEAGGEWLGCMRCFDFVRSTFWAIEHLIRKVLHVFIWISSQFAILPSHFIWLNLCYMMLLFERHGIMFCPTSFTHHIDEPMSYDALVWETKLLCFALPIVAESSKGHSWSNGLILRYLTRAVGKISCTSVW